MNDRGLEVYNILREHFSEKSSEVLFSFLSSPSKRERLSLDAYMAFRERLSEDDAMRLVTLMAN